MVFPVVGGDGKPTGYEIDNSLRFNDGDLPLLTRTHSDTNHRTFTFSCWVKRSALGTGNMRLFNTDDEASDDFRIRFTSADILHISDNQSGTSYELDTNRKFRDISAWYHIVVAWDTTQGTAANRIKLYVNGVQETSFSTASYPTQNFDTLVNQNTSHEVGGSLYDADGTGPRQPFDGYMSEVYFIDGTAYAASDFGETNDNGVWIPKDAKGDLTFGTNGFYMEFQQTGTSANSSGMGADTSGNDNHFAATNLAATDVTTDTPTNNFCTYNAVDTSSNITLSEGNTLATANSNHSASRATIGLRNGKWYWENKIVSDSGGPAVGIMAANASLVDQLNSTPSRFYRDSGQKITDGTASNYGNTYTTNDIIGVALDLDNGAIYFYKNGTIQNSGTAAFTDLLTATTEHWLPAVKLYNEAISINFGNPSHSISSGNADANGYGNFEYAVPSGYYSLCTKNLAEYG